MDLTPERIMLLRVPLDILPPEDIPGFFHSLIAEDDSPNAYQRGRDIVLLSVWDLLRARRNNEYRNFILRAALVIPISKSLVSGARFLTGKKLIRYMPFNFIISLLSSLEKREYQLYLLGAKSQILKKAEKNIHATFPRLRIVGRCTGYIKRQEEPALIEAIRKASPSLLLAGKGIRGGELWIARNGTRLNTGFRLWCSDLFHVFAEKRRRPSDAVFDRGLESIGFCLRNPLLFFRIFPFLRYKLLLLFYKLFRS